MIWTILLVVALVLVIMDLVRSQGKNLTAWAVLILILQILLPAIR